MAYITLEELKEILPEIMRDWIDKDDESWEWIFQEIEQKCHVGKKKKEPVNCGTCKYFVSNNGVGYCDGGMPCYGYSQWEKKKDKKPKKKDMQNAMEIAIMAHRNDINELTKKIETLSDKYTKLIDRINNMNRDINVAKSMAETAKQRTEVDYSKYKQPISYGLWSDCKRIIATCERFGATKEELEQLDLMLSKYIRNPSKTTEPVESCTTCKHYRGDGVIEETCITCNAYEHWEAKDE